MTLHGFLAAAGDKYWEFHLDRGALLRKAVHDQVALLAGRRACPVPSPAAIDGALVRAIAKHATASTVERGILTRDEAITLVIAHLQADAIGVGHGMEHSDEPGLIAAVEAFVFRGG